MINDRIISIKSNTEIQDEIADRCKKLRLAKNLSRDSLAKNAGVSAATLRHFEQSAQISLKSLIKIAMALDCTNELFQLFQPPKVETLEDLRKSEQTQRRRGRN
jgi:transcriptional regulator with XRE-family HTH domain